MKGRVSATSYDFEAPLWRWDARQSQTWTFVSLPQEIADEIAERGGSLPRGFGSMRVEVTVGNSAWRTSIFPSSSEGTYVLPIKRAVRAAEGLSEGTGVMVHIELMDD